MLVDELAHTNVEGSRHPKRYLDVEELLAAGIDVYTTLNVQHLESLNDVVAKITRVRVHETVPDSIFDRANEVELVDLTPEDLQQRLREGKVYVPEMAERAAQNYFQPGNITALRELALRRTAQRVDDQMVTYMRAHAIQGPWEAGERVLVCVGEHPDSVALVRYARRLSDRLRAGWAALYVETAGARRFTDAERGRIAEALRVAERLGGQAVTIPADDIAGGILDYAHANNFTHIVTAAARPAWWRDWLGGSVTQQLVRRAGDISLHIVPAQLVRAMKGASPRPRLLRPEFGQASDGKAYLGSFAMVMAALAFGLLLQRENIGASNIGLVFLTAVLTSAVTYGLWPALFAVAVSALAYNFFFFQPLYTFTIADPANAIAVFFFGFAAIVAGNLAARVRAQAMMARDRAAMTENLYAFSRKLAGVFTLDDLLWATAFHIAQMLKVRAVILLPDGESIAVRAGYPPEDMLDAADMAAAKWVWDHATPAGRGADTLPGARRLFLPMRTGRGMVGVVGLDKDGTGPILSSDERRLFDALADQASLAIERILLRRRGPHALRGGKRAAARGAAHLHLPRPAHAAGLHPRFGDQPEGSARRAGPGGGNRTARHHSGGSRAPQPLHRQSPGHDAAGIRRAGAAAGTHRHRRRDRQRPAPRGTRARTTPDRDGARGGFAAVAPGPRAVRAGAVQPARQRCEVCARWKHHCPAQLRRRPRSGVDRDG